MEYEAGIKDYQGRKLIMHEKLETRNGMLKTNPKVKYDKNMNVNNAMKTRLYEKPEPSDGMLKINSKPVIKSLGEAAFENILDKDFGKHRVHEKPGMRAVMDGEINMFEEAKTRMLKTNPKGKHDENLNVNEVMTKNNAATPIKDPNTVQW
jgi:hypothetical protein